MQLDAVISVIIIIINAVSAAVTVAYHVLTDRSCAHLSACRPDDRRVPLSPNSITPTFPKLPPFRGGRRNGIWAKRDVTGLSRTSRRSRHSGIWALHAWVRSTMTATNHDEQRHNLVKCVQRCREFGNFLKVRRWFSRFHCCGRHSLGPRPIRVMKSPSSLCQS